MSETTKIQWADATLNLWEGCTKIAPACTRCYAEVRARRFGSVEWGPGKPRRRVKSRHAILRKIQRRAVAEGRRLRVFIGSLMDFFDAEVPDDWRTEGWEMMREHDRVDWILLTKRPEHVAHTLPNWWPIGGRSNVWLLCSVGTQDRLEDLAPFLHALEPWFPLIGLSCEPLLEPLDLSRIHLPSLGWIIVGGESGPHARRCEYGWIRDLVRQARATKTPVYVKQLGTAWVDEINGVRGRGIPEPDPGLVPRPRVLRDPKGGDPTEWPECLRVRLIPGDTP